MSIQKWDNQLWLVMIFLSLTVMFGCKPKSNKIVSPDGHELMIVKPENLRKKDLSHLKPEERSKWTFLTFGYFKKAAQLKGSEVMNMDSTQGSWVKFYDDNTYELGDENVINQSGKWDYNNEETTIELINADKNGSNSEYKLMYNDVVIVFIGTPKYGNNHEQIKWIRVEE